MKKRRRKKAENKMGSTGGFNGGLDHALEPYWLKQPPFSTTASCTGSTGFIPGWRVIKRTFQSERSPACSGRVAAMEEARSEQPNEPKNSTEHRIVIDLKIPEAVADYSTKVGEATL